MSRFDETCAICSVPIVASLFQKDTLCSECRAKRAVEDSAPLRMPAEVPGAWYEPTPDGFRLGAKIGSWRECAGFTVSVFFVGWIIRQGAGPAVFTIIFISLAGLWQLATALFGVVRLTRDGSVFTEFTGAGGLGRTRIYDWGDLTSVHEQSASGGEGSQGTEIVIVGARRAAFGRQLTPERRFFVREVLRLELKRGRGSA